MNRSPILLAAVVLTASLGLLAAGEAQTGEKRTLKPTAAYRFDGFSLGDSFADKVMNRAPYDQPCDNDPIDNKARRFMVYGAQPCRGRSFPEKTTVMFYLKHSAQNRYAQPIEAFAYLHGSYFNDKSDYHTRPGDKLEDARAKLGAIVRNFKLERKGHVLEVLQSAGDVHILHRDGIVVGLVFGAMPADPDNEQWRGLMQMYSGTPRRAERSMYVVGIDENGLGPLLGPLVVTGAILELRGEYDPTKLAAALSGGVRVDDSKAFMSHGKPAAGEQTALAFLNQRPDGRPRSADALLERLALPSPVPDRACPAASLCHGPDLALPCFGAANDETQAALDAASAELRERLKRAGVRFVGALTIPLCARDFNRLVQVRGGKLALDLSLFEQVMLAAHERLAHREALYLCGKIGARKAYRGALSLLKRFPARTLSEEPARSAYRAEGLGQIEFVRDGDALHPPTALASVIGKYVRELAMTRINRFLGEQLPDSRPASGYRDPVTKKLVTDSATLREELDIPGECFCRIR